MKHIGIFTGKIYYGDTFLDEVHECVMEYNEFLSEDENMTRWINRRLMICPTCADCYEKQNATRD